MPYAEVAVNAFFPHRDTFTYEIPAGLDVRLGQAVFVPFGRRRLQGVVLALTETPRFDVERVVSIDGVIEDEPLLGEAHVELARWLAWEYIAPPFPCARLMLPPGFEQRPLTFYDALPEEIAGVSPTDRQRAAWNYLRENGPVEATTAAAALREATSRTLDALVRRGLAVRTFGLAPSRGRHRTVPQVRLAASRADAERWLDHPRGEKPSRAADLLEMLAERGALDADVARPFAAAAESLAKRGLVRIEDDGVSLGVSPGQAHDVALDLRLTAAQRAQVETLRLLLDEGPVVPRSVVRARTGIAMPALRELVEQGLVVLDDAIVDRDPLAGADIPLRAAPTLTRDQAAALRPILDVIGRGEGATFLLHGVTGSGKTEIYLSALEHAVAAGRRGIALVPEIALTPQTVRRFAERFPGRVAVLHSGLSLGQRFDQWWRIRRGDYDVVVGARQALFAPQPDLGLIVIDEEHEWTYKQHDAMPRYHARETAERLAALVGATVLLGSATPDVVSYHRARAGRYRLLELLERVAAHEDDGGPREARPASRPLPAVDVVDMREELRAGERGVFSRSLRAEIAAALDREEQVILFLNRRGSASFLLCRDCGYAPACSSCGPAFSFHDDVGRLVCHQCGRTRSKPDACPKCGSARIRGVGLGTQRLEEETALAFPEARVLRWDRDATRLRGAHERILMQFLTRQADILIGTQMVAKGLDLPHVTLVGVVAADIGLHVPDFRAGERTYQLLAQVAGRAGRGPRGGRVIIQTYVPDHYAIEAAARHDYDAMYVGEIEGRRALGYPPFGRLTQLTYTGSGERRSLAEAERMVARLAEEARRRGEPGAWVRGPAPAYVPRRRGRWRWHVLLRSPDHADPAALVRDLPLGEGWEIDVDPVTLA